jgi:hypothetical protein
MIKLLNHNHIRKQFLSRCFTSKLNPSEEKQVFADFTNYRETEDSKQYNEDHKAKDSNFIYYDSIVLKESQLKIILILWDFMSSKKALRPFKTNTMMRLNNT